MMRLNYIDTCDNIDGLRRLPADCIDLTVTSPPYDNLRVYKGFSWDADGLIAELYRVTKPGGVVVWVVNDATVNGSETGSSFRQALAFMAAGFNLHDTMIWEKTGMLPTQDRYYAIFEYMFVFSKGKPKAMNFICDRKTTAGGRVQKKDACINKGKQKIGRGTFVRKEYSRRTNIWRIAIGKNKETKGHPAPFPEQLAADHIASWSNPGDIVLDPFIGSGTTAVACVKTGRNYIGFEIIEEYCDIARQRVASVQEQMKIGG